MAFHPAYKDNATGDDWVLSSGFKWVWSGASLTFTPNHTTLAGTTPSTGAAGDYANFVEIKAATAGKYPVTVSENAPSAWGISCAATTTAFDIYAFDEPSFTAETTGDAGIKSCVDKEVKVYFKVLASGTPHFKYTVKKYNGMITNAATGEMGINATTPNEQTVVSNEGTHNSSLTAWKYDVNVGAKINFPTTGTDGVSVEVTKALVVATPTLAEYNVGIQRSLTAPGATDPSIVVYRFFLDQVNGLISRNGDYDKDGTFTESFYPATAATDKYVDVYMIKAPKTGPVYHISNNKAI